MTVNLYGSLGRLDAGSAASILTVTTERKPPEFGGAISPASMAALDVDFQSCATISPSLQALSTTGDFRLNFLREFVCVRDGYKLIMWMKYANATSYVNATS